MLSNCQIFIVKMFHQNDLYKMYVITLSMAVQLLKMPKTVNVVVDHVSNFFSIFKLLEFANVCK